MKITYQIKLNPNQNNHKWFLKTCKIKMVTKNKLSLLKVTVFRSNKMIKITTQAINLSIKIYKAI